MSFNYKTQKWLRKRAAILKRDNYMCQECKKYGRITEAQTVHHIKPAELFPELVYTNENLISLCNACHNREHPEKAFKLLKK